MSSGSRFLNADGQSLARVRARYTRLAPIYELTLADRLIYAGARERAVELLHLTPGATVVDVACGTGLNFPRVQRRIGPTGHLIGVDLTPGMLARAGERVERSHWRNVTLLQVDAASLSRQKLHDAGALPAAGAVDAAICTLGLSVIPDWQKALRSMAAVVRPGGRVAIMDGGFAPERAAIQAAAFLRPLVWLICRFSAAESTRQPWTRASADLVKVQTSTYSYGYVHVAAGTTSDKLHTLGLASPRDWERVK